MIHSLGFDPHLKKQFFYQIGLEDCRVTRLGNFWKFLAQNLNSKVAKMFVDFLCYFEKHNSLLKTAVAAFWDNFWKNLGYFLFQHLVTLELREENITKLLFRFCIFLKMGQPRPLIIYFWSFQTNIITILATNICEKCPSSIWCWDSNPLPLEHGLLP